MRKRNVGGFVEEERDAVGKEPEKIVYLLAEEIACLRESAHAAKYGLFLKDCHRFFPDVWISILTYCTIRLRMNVY